ncbi:MAG: PIG-L family deacetylase [Sphingomicrobium sp.]
MAGSEHKFTDGLNLFILAHPDDEVAFAPIIHRLVGERRPVRLIYLTDGSSGGSPSVRQAETVRALAWLGVAALNLRFAGHEVGIADGQLHRNLDRALHALEQWCAASQSIACIYTLAWEGGHPDHDSAHVVAAAFAAGRGVASRVRQVPFYRASDRWPAPIFTVGAPLPANGPVVSIALSLEERWLPVRLIRFYRSQWRSFVGLAPVILWHALTHRSFKMQDLSKPRLANRPTERPLLYEVRNGVRCEDVLAAAAAFLALQRQARQPDRVPVTAAAVRIA